MMWGAPGIGKSDIVKQIGEEQEQNSDRYSIPLWEPTDIKGIPYYNAKENNMVWAAPAELPTDPKSTAIIFLR
jgi:MoxR-like ATPase